MSHHFVTLPDNRAADLGFVKTKTHGLLVSSERTRSDRHEGPIGDYFWRLYDKQRASRLF